MEKPNKYIKSSNAFNNGCGRVKPRMLSKYCIRKDTLIKKVLGSKNLPTEVSWQKHEKWKKWGPNFMEI